MPPKRRRPNANTLSKRAKKSSAGAIDNEYHSAVVVSRASVNELQTLTARVLCSHLQAYSLPTSGNKAKMVNCLYQHFHTSENHVSTNPNNSVSASLELTEEQHTRVTTLDNHNPTPSGSGVFLPQQFADQLSNLLQHFTPATSQGGATQTTTITESLTSSQSITTSNQSITISNQPSATGNQCLLTLPVTSHQLPASHEVLSATSPIQSLTLTTNANAVNCYTANSLPML